MMSNNVSVISDSQTYFYPNPSSTITKFMFSEKIAHLIVLDNLGKTVKNIILHNQQSIDIDISDLHHGIYICSTD